MKHKLNATINELKLKSIRKVVKCANTWNDEVKSYSNDALKQKTIKFKERLASGVDTLDTLLPEAYAVAREASWRALDMYPKEAQLAGTIVLHEGNITGVQTSEGKTLTATMPSHLNVPSGKEIYLITANDCLTGRDSGGMQSLYEWLGLTISLDFVGIVDYEHQKGEKCNIYEHGTIYTTNGCPGLDYLINNSADSVEGRFLPRLNYGIIDEVDSIILDAIQTLLVISGVPRLRSNPFHIAKESVDALTEDAHFKMKKTKEEIWLLNQGIEAAQSYFNIEDLHNE